MTLKQIYTFFLVLCVGSVSVLPAFGETVDLTGEFAPIERTFVVSAYYSPKPGQTYYYRGSFEADVRLNGGGVRGASGRAVFPGMIAAPKTYPFGVKIALPGMGVGEVTDRGGAIVPAGERGYAYDRLDVWMGEGEEGLARALAWGKRTVTGTVYAKSSAVEVSFTLPTNTAALARLPKASVVQASVVAVMQQPVDARFPVTLSKGDSGERVREVQMALATLALYDCEINGVYDEEMAGCMADFQVGAGVLGSKDEQGSGVFGPKTREALLSKLGAKEKIQESATSAVLPAETLSPGDTGEQVERLQKGLGFLGYGVPVTGAYDAATRDAVTALQVKEGVLSSATETGSGFFGTRTLAAYKGAVLARAEAVPAAPANPAWDRKEVTPVVPVFTVTLSKGDAGEQVKQAQEVLGRLGYVVAVTGEFDATTEEAVIAFQKESGIVASAADTGAGVLGPRTRDALNAAVQREKIAVLPIAVASAK